MAGERATGAELVRYERRGAVDAAGDRSDRPGS